MEQPFDTARHMLFAKITKSEGMPPTSDAFQHHLMRVHYQTMVWRKASVTSPDLLVPTEFGWKQGPNELQPMLMKLSPIPESCKGARCIVTYADANVKNLDCSVQICARVTRRTLNHTA